MDCNEFFFVQVWTQDLAAIYFKCEQQLQHPLEKFVLPSPAERARRASRHDPTNTSMTKELHCSDPPTRTGCTWKWTATLSGTKACEQSADMAENCFSSLVVILPRFVVQTELLSVVYLLHTPSLNGLPLVQADV